MHFCSRLTLVAALLVVSASACVTGANGPSGPDGGSDGEAAEGEGEPHEGEGEGEHVGEGEGEGAEGEGEGEGEAPSGPQTVLLIGNSQLGFFGGNPQPPDVTLALASMSSTFADGASNLVVDRYSQPGVGCAGFLAAGTGPGSAQALASSGNYDVVILLPSINESNRAANEGCWDTFRNLAENAGSRFGVMATGHVSSQYPAGVDALDAAIRSYANDNNLLFIPAGATWRRLLGDAPTSTDLLELFGSDFAHPGPEGSYLYVLALYGALTHRSVVGVDNDLPPLRCSPNTSCLTEQQVRECLNDRGEWGCSAGNGAVFISPGRVSFVDDDEALLYQQIVDQVLSER